MVEGRAMGRSRKWEVALAVLAVCAVAVLWQPKHPGQTGRLRLPIGNVTPAVSIGYDHGLVLASDGSLWTWGKSEVLGLGGITNQPILRRIGKDTDWRNISTGFRHSLAIKSDGSLWAWGENDSGQLGDGTFIDRSSPIRSVPGSNWKQVSAGFDYSLGIKRDGTLWAWGDESPPQSGVAARSAGPVAVRVGLASNWTKVSADIVGRIVGMQTDGSIWVLAPWGVDPAAQILPGADWLDFGSGTHTVLAIKSDRSLWAQGQYAGYLANAPVESPVQLGTNTDWKAVCGGEDYELILKKSGEIWMLDVGAFKYKHGRPWKELPIT
jgi:alpha-tubulin suppressor-like RCC1 family protein